MWPVGPIALLFRLSGVKSGFFLQIKLVGMWLSDNYYCTLVALGSKMISMVEEGCGQNVDSAALVM